MLKILKHIVNFIVILPFCFHNAIIKPTAGHFVGLYVQSDPIQTVSSIARLATTKRPPNWQYCIPVLILFFTVSYGSVGLYYESNDVGQFNWGELHLAPYIFTHRISPPVIWSQMDFCFILDLMAANCIYALNAATKQVDKKFRYFKVGDKIIAGSVELGSVESVLIIKFRNQIKFVIHGITLLYGGGWNIYFLIQAWLSQTTNFNWRLFLYWFVVFPVGIFYLVYALCTTVLYAILASQYIQIQQKELIREFVKINQILQNNQTGKKSVLQFLLSFQQFKRINREIVQLSQVIREYSRCCKPILSVAIPFYVTVQCYLLYIVLFAGNSLTQKSIAFTGFMESNLNLFVIINACARVGQLSSRLEQLNRKFYLAYLHRGGFGLLNNAAVFKMHSFQLSRRLRCYSFHLFCNYRITSKTFYLIISYITTYFVFMFKRQYST